MKLGEFIKGKRLEKDISLRKFAGLIEYDAANWSKIERGLMPPPPDEETDLYRNIAKILDLNGEQYYDMINLAAIDRKEIPNYVYSDAEVLKALPIFFRTANGEKLSPEQLEEIIKIIKNR